ncbi:MAG: ATP-binding protein [Oscillospiraceae bacterium]|nr:ATP-binding protein [Oscillospiraceae bacterium]
MALDGKLLGSARQKLALIREENRAEEERRLRSIYLRIPEIEKIDLEMRRQMSELVKLTVSRDPELRERLEALERENLRLQADRERLLAEHGYAPDWLEPVFSCRKCRDTGYMEGRLCSCLKTLYNRELTEKLGVLLQTGGECFENFDLSLYGQHRPEMELVFGTCRNYAADFSPNSMNLLFQGRTGLGKTYLSACIARVVAEKGFSLCYDTAVSALEAFELRKFSRDPAAAEAADLRVSRMLDCDLMILDDLGTEMITSVSLSALYTLINSRLLKGRPTIISTNLSDEELKKRYTPQIISRIQGEFTLLPFSGQDIRLIKKEL